jgi:two-component system capsular synthesis sensor histidine kinase RcsC
MGGTLTIESQPNQGSCIICSIPVEHPPPCKLLVIEDNPLVQYMLSMQLEETHCVHDMADSAKAALALLHTNTYQLVISDLGLPNMDAISLAKQIKKQHPTLPIIALSAHINKNIAQDCLSAGMHSCYQKPLRMAQLEEILTIIPAGEPT